MTTKYKINCTIDGETLWGILSKFLPFENLHVEEVVERPKPVSVLKLAKLDAVKPKQKRAPRKSHPLNTEEGVNGVITRVLADGEPHRYAELKRTVAAAGYAETGLGSRLKRLLEYGAIINIEQGLWRIAPKKDE